ncbi:MAG: hypothetical protein Q4C61_11650 [Lachnospiraceae bacterium]|nr:hypothetical protein [Lachnospiraceae bacterium]
MESGVHYVPVTEEVAERFRRIIANWGAPKVEPMVVLHWEKYMGQSDISVTLNTYTHVNFDEERDELTRVLNA